MNRISQIIGLAKSRTGLIVIVSVLLVLNLGRFVTGKYHEVIDSIESKQALLGQYRISTQNIETLRKRIKMLEQQKREFEGHLFIGESREEVTSSMQIKLQEILGLAGLSPESLRPLAKGGKDEDQKYYGEVIVKIRMTGNLDNFIKFLSELYRMNYLFKIENFTLKPFKKTQLKVFIELKGFYRLTGKVS